MWTEIVRASTADELQNTIPAYSEIPAGTEVNIHLELQWWAPIGKLADMTGAEWWAPQLAQADMDVIDVSGNWHYIDIRGRARGMPVVLLIVIIAAAVAVLGLGVYLASVIITANMETKKLEQVNEWVLAGFSPEQIAQMLEGVKFEPTTPSLPAIAGISTGVLIVGAIVLFLVLRR